MQYSNQLSAAVALLGLSLVVGGSAKAGLIQDPGFENGPAFGPWIQGGNTISDTINPPNGRTDPTHSGNYQAWMGAPSGTSYISQNVPTSAGHTYLIDFWMANGATGPASYNISWGGTTYLSSGPVVAAFGYTEFQFTAPYVGTPTTVLKLEFYNMLDWFRIDDVSVTEMSAGGGGGGGPVPDQGPGLILSLTVIAGLVSLARYGSTPKLIG